MDGNIIASSMGKVAHGAECSFEDKCKSLILSFAINIAMVIQLQMKLQNNNNCVLLASKFHNEYFYFAVQSIIKFFHPEGHILFGDLGNYMGCLGNIEL
jgi:pantothenate kinase